MANKVADVEHVAGVENGASRALLARLPRLGVSPAPVRDVTAQVVAAETAAAPSAEDDVRAYALLGAAAVATGPITAMAELGANLLTANYADDSLSLLARRGPRRAARVEEVFEPFAIAIAGDRAYVSSVEPVYDTVSVLQRGEITARIPVAGSLRDLAVSPDGRRVFALQATDRGILLGVIDAQTHEISNVELVAGPHNVPAALAVSPDGEFVYVAAVDHVSGVVMKVREGRVVGAAPIPSMVRDIAVTPDGGLIVAVSDDDDFGGVVDFVSTDTLQTVGSVELGAAAVQVAISADGERTYVVSGDHVTVVCTATQRIIDRVDVGVDLTSVLESRDGAQLYVADATGRVTTYQVNVTSNEALAQIFDAAVVDVPMRELEPAAV